MGSFFSFREVGSEDKPFQLLSYRQSPSLMPSFRKKKEYIAKLTVQRLDTWMVRREGDDIRQLDVFECEEPMHVDLGSWICDEKDMGPLVQVA